MDLEEYKDRLIESVVRGTDFQPEDVIGIALGINNNSGIRLFAIYLTERGEKEANQENLRPLYNQLREKVPEFCTNMVSYAPVISESIKRMEKKFVRLEGDDMLKRILVLYTY